MIDNALKHRSLTIAKSLAPVDTGNLRHNAIRLTNVKPNSWSISYSTVSANYLEPLEEGWFDKRTGEIHDSHKGFIAKTSRILSVYLTMHMNGFRSNKWYEKRLEKVFETSSDTEQRRFRHRESIMNYYSRN